MRFGCWLVCAVHSLSPWPEGSRAIAIGYQASHGALLLAGGEGGKGTSVVSPLPRTACAHMLSHGWRLMVLGTSRHTSCVLACAVLSLCVQRGKRRRGATRSVYPSKQPGRLGAVVRFNEKFEMPVTLYKVRVLCVGPWVRRSRGAAWRVCRGGGWHPVNTLADTRADTARTAQHTHARQASGNATNGGTALGPFKKKCLILAVLETDGRTQATAALGRVVVDLSEYASVDHQETRTFMVTCNKAIHGAVGDPQLMLSIRCGAVPGFVCWGGGGGWGH